jgi:hypothetical protein
LWQFRSKVHWVQYTAGHICWRNQNRALMPMFFQGKVNKWTILLLYICKSTRYWSCQAVKIERRVGTFFCEFLEIHSKYSNLIVMIMIKSYF